MTFPQISDTILKFLIYIFQEKLPRLENYPNCGRVGNPENVECIWDCEWVDSPKTVGSPFTTGLPMLNVALNEAGFTHGLVKYPSNIDCLDDCTMLAKIEEAAANSIDPVTLAVNLFALADPAIRQGPNIDSMIVEICLLYFELEPPPSRTCFNLPPAIVIGRNLKTNNLSRLIGNSLTNSYTDSTLNYTLNQYPWTCSLRTTGYRGRHICGTTLLSAPLSRTIIVGAAHCNYICKSSEGTVRETCCCRDPDDNFASCRTVSIVTLCFGYIFHYHSF